MPPVTKKKIVAEASDYKREKHANEEKQRERRGERGTRGNNEEFLPHKRLADGTSDK